MTIIKSRRIVVAIVLAAALALVVGLAAGSAQAAGPPHGERNALLRKDVAHKMAHKSYVDNQAKMLRLYGTRHAKLLRCPYIRRSYIRCTVDLYYPGNPPQYQHDRAYIHIVRTFVDYAWANMNQDLKP